MVYAYELSDALNKTNEAVKGQWVPLPQNAINLVVHELLEKLKNLGFYKQGGRQEQERFYRDVISRAGLTKKEAVYFAEIVGKAGRLSSKASSEHVDSNC
jgi:tRNA/rRNA methyltransferase/tRNA (cytidine32/uridine32-2'-O)-methyltransferase